MQPELIKDKVEAGFIHCRVIIEMAGKPKEHVEGTLKKYVEKIKESTVFEIIKEDLQECIEQNDMWSTFIEIEMLVKGLSSFIGFCFDFMPSSVEVLAPQSMNFKRETVSHFLNDMQAKLHSLDMTTKQRTAEAEFMKRNFNNIVRNLIAVVLYKKELTIRDTSLITGLPEQDLHPILDNLVKEGKLAFTGEKYTLVVGKEVDNDGEKQS